MNKLYDDVLDNVLSFIGTNYDLNKIRLVNKSLYKHIKSKHIISKVRLEKINNNHKELILRDKDLYVLLGLYNMDDDYEFDIKNSLNFDFYNDRFNFFDLVIIYEDKIIGAMEYDNYCIDPDYTLILNNYDNDFILHELFSKLDVRVIYVQFAELNFDNMMKFTGYDKTQFYPNGDYIYKNKTLI